MERTIYKPLAARKAAAGTTYHQPSTFQTVRLDSPAICVMTDLTKVSAATIAADVSLAKATQTMISRGVRLLFVADGDEVIGLITARDTQGEKPIKLVQERGLKFPDLTVRDLMVPREQIDLLDAGDVLRAEVGHIVATLEAWGRQHALVGDTDPVTGQMRIRGIFSATQIGRQLGVAVQTFEVAKTFAEIKQALGA